MQYELTELNHRAATDPKGYIEESEKRYFDNVERAASTIAKGCAEKPIVLINGPSSSGKTTTCDRLYRALERRGIHGITISMDDYYRTNGTYEVPRDEKNGVPDLESPECMDLPLLSRDLTHLAAGEEISVPRFDFETRISLPHQRSIRLQADEVAIIEGIHSFNPAIMGDLAPLSTGIFLSVASSVQPEAGDTIQKYMLRFLRRAERDKRFRNSPVEATLRQWPSVRRGEKLYISPYRRQAAVIIDSFLPYELNILMNALREELKLNRGLMDNDLLAPLVPILDQVAPIDYLPYMPEQSVLHEFIG